MSSETETSDPAEASLPDEQSQQREESPEGTDWRAENTRLRQELKKAKDLNREALPFAQLGVALQQAPGGDKIVEKLRKGEALTAAQEAKLEKAQEQTGTAALSPEQIQKMLDSAAQTFEQRYWESRKAERAMESLHKWAGEKYAGYDELHTTPQWNQHLSTVLAAIEHGTLELPDDWSDPYRYAVHQTYAWVKSLNPDVGKKVPAKKTEKERRSAISQSSVDASGVAPEDSDQLPEWARLDATPRSPTGGRAFGSLKRS